MNPIQIESSITIQGFELQVHLGWPPSERLQQQVVVLDIYVQFLNPPPACSSDHLDDTYCYEKLTTLIVAQLAGKHFRLIEHLGQQIYQIIKGLLHDTSVKIRLTKRTAIPHLTGGVSFQYGDPL